MSVEPSRSQRDLHFDLSHLGDGHRDGAYTLRAGKSRYKLAPHTPQTLRDAGFADPKRAGTPTHLAHGVTTATNQVQLLLVYGIPVGSALPPLASIAISTPSDSATYGPEDIGKALVFLNPTVSVLTPRHADTVLGHIKNTDRLPGLTAAINAAGANWCTPQPLTSEGRPVLKAGATPAYTYVLDPGVLNSTAPVSGQSKAAIYSDTSLEGARWRMQQGRSYIDMNAAAAAPARRAPGASGGYNINLQDGGPNFGVSVTLNGLSQDFVLDLDVTNSYIRHCAVFVSFLDINGNAITVADNIWTQLAKGAMALVLEDYFQITRQTGGQQLLQLLSESSNTLKWCGLVSSESTFMGIPVSSTDINFTFKLPTVDQKNNPVQVSKIRLLVGSMGVSSGIDWDPQAAWLGLALTGFFDLALPTYALVTGVGEESNGLFNDIFTDKGFLLSTAFSVFTVAKDLFTGSPNLGNDMSSALTSLADSLVSKVLTSSEMIAKLAAWFGAEEAAEAVPVVGWAVKVAALEATVEQLAQSIGEIVGSPRVVEFDMTLTMNVQITLVPDPKTSDEFPSTATSCLITAQYSANTARTYTADVTGKTKTTAIVIEWDQVPVGGTVNFIVAMTDPNGWGVGKGHSGSVTNLINGTDKNGNPALLVQITVTQELYPLGPDTTYLHDQLLQYGPQGNATGYYWEQTNLAPADTLAALGTGQSGNVLERLHGITLSDDLGILGYAWEASGLGIPPIDDDTPRTELFTMQNIGFKPLANDTSPFYPQAGYMTAPAGYSKGVRLLYVRTTQGGTSVPGSGCFFLDPSGDRIGGFHLRAVLPVTSPSVPMTDPWRQFDLATGASFGRFAIFPASLAIHSNGYVVAVNGAYDALQILRLPTQAVPDAEAPWAYMPTGSGTGPGRLSQPTLVAIRPDQTILVLEAGNRRIQAFSCGGHPVSIAPLSGRPMYWIPLASHAPAGTNVVYVSMSVDVAGYSYVLSYNGNGYAVSDFFLDIYTPTGVHLCSQQGFNTAGLAVDLWRNVYTLNFQQIAGPSGQTQPSLSEYIPSTPKPK